jgi:hypothetical protein
MEHFGEIKGEVGGNGHIWCLKAMYDTRDFPTVQKYEISKHNTCIVKKVNFVGGGRLFKQ